MVSSKFTTASQVLPTYNYTDVADGTGVITFYPTVAVDSVGDAHILSTVQQPSGRPSISLGGTGTENKNFDLTAFNISRTITGTATLSIALGADNGKTCNVSAQVQKWDGTTETNCSSVITSVNFTGVTTNGTQADQLFMDIPLTETLFAVGDVLRLNLILTQTNAGDGTEFGCDPTGANSVKGWIIPANDVTTKTQLNIPFKLDL